MLQKLSRRAEDEKGFTLIELLVVILIIGILAAIAIPAFLNQRGKAYDAAAKSQVKTAQTAMETYATDHNGSYTAQKSDLVAIEPTLGDTGTGSSLTTVNGSGTSSYTLTTVNGSGTSSHTLTSTASSTGDTFTITDTGGTVQRSCAAGSGGGSSGGCSGTTW
jgi:type IV pilus assembly protein PilA